MKYVNTKEFQTYCFVRGENIRFYAIFACEIVGVS